VDALSASALIVGAIVFLSLLFSGLLFRIFWNVLLTAALVTLTAWIVILMLGFSMFIFFPVYCGLTNNDFEEAFKSVFLPLCLAAER